MVTPPCYCLKHRGAILVGVLSKTSECCLRGSAGALGTKVVAVGTISESLTTDHSGNSGSTETEACQCCKDFNTMTVIGGRSQCYGGPAEDTGLRAERPILGDIRCSKQANTGAWRPVPEEPLPGP